MLGMLRCTCDETLDCDGGAATGMNGWRILMMRKIALLSLAMVVAGTTTAAAQRPLSLDMTCGRAAALVSSRGAVVMSTGQYTYDRYVATRAFCLPLQQVEVARVPTLDDPYCRVGYTCVDRDLRRNRR